MNTRTGTLTIATAAVLAAALAGCNRTADVGPITSATKTTTSSATSAPSTPLTSMPSTSTTLDPAAKESQDRQDVELVWRKFDALAFTAETMPADQAKSAMAAVAIDPALTRLRDQDTQFRAEHKAGYGLNVSYFAWDKLINGADVAMFTDCQDGSQAGYLDTRTGNKLTVGTVQTPIRGTMQRTAQGWKVADAQLIQGATCMPGK